MIDEPTRPGSNRRRSRPESSSNVIVRALVQAGLGDEAWRLTINELWAESVGPNISKRTQVIGFSRGVLKVRVASATWQQELTFLRVTIVQKLNARLGAQRIKAIKVMGGHVPNASDDHFCVETTTSPVPDDTGPQWGNKEDGVGEQIACPEVRAAFQRLRRKQLRT